MTSVQQPTLYIHYEGDYSFTGHKIAYTLEKQTNTFMYLKPYGLYNTTTGQISPWYNNKNCNTIRRMDFRMKELH